MHLYHKIIGTGDPVIIIHGLFGMSDNWATFAKRLSETHMVILVDVRNHGRSKHTDSFTYQDAANDIAELCEENWIYNATIIGHSMGGKLAMQLSHDHPEIVERLIVVDIAPVTYNGGHELIIKTLLGIDLGSAVTRKDIEEKIYKEIPDLVVVRFLMKNLARDKENGGFRWKMNLPVLSQAYNNILAEIVIRDIDIPTLFVKGEKSDYILSEHEEIIDAIFESYEIVEIAEAGHWVHADAPEALLSLVQSFLE